MSETQLTERPKASMKPLGRAVQVTIHVNQALALGLESLARKEAPNDQFEKFLRREIGKYLDKWDEIMNTSERRGYEDPLPDGSREGIESPSDRDYLDSESELLVFLMSKEDFESAVEICKWRNAGIVFDAIKNSQTKTEPFETVADWIREEIIKDKSGLMYSLMKNNFDSRISSIRTKSREEKRKEFEEHLEKEQKKAEKAVLPSERKRPRS
ncbi:MAG: hypothetical protein ACYCQJ_13020 [Nitrososphaerales archaeon]